MNATSLDPGGWSVQPRRADAQDVRFAYLLLLGRAVESPQALRAKQGRPFEGLMADFLHSTEFRVGVAQPLLEGRAIGPDRFTDAPSGALRRWTARRVLGDARVDMPPSPDDWTGLWRELLASPATSAILDAGLGEGEAEALRKALALRTRGLSEASVPPAPDAADRALRPVVSVVLCAPGADDLLDVCALIDPAVPARIELLVVGGPLVGSGSAWIEALQDAGRPVKAIELGAAGPLAAALEEAAGDYLLVRPSGCAAPAELVVWSRDLVVHDRPEALVAGDTLLMRVDVAARMVRLGRAKDWPAADLVADLRSLGARVETSSPSAAPERA